VPGGLVVDLKDVEQLPDDKIVLISTGSQGEPMSALSRMANRDHHLVRIEQGDTIVLASSLIPGNENAVFRVINGLTRWGAQVVHKSTALVHVSGHAPAGELLYVLNAVRPSNLMPVHGEWRHLRAHAALAELTGLAPERVVIAEDGVVVDLVDGIARVAGAVECGYVYVDGSSVGDVTEVSLKDRRILGEEGILTITIVVDSATGKIVSGPDIHARGVSDEPGAFDDAARLAARAVEDGLLEGVTDRQALQQRVRRAVGRWVSDTYRRRPMIAPIVLEV
jgi:ribonuclease J